ncbi:MAG TPA: pteridine-dependent deoxygenase [Rhodanobacteraceae bacterium]|nr:pteridine-dependent deoxygenase [Rhodanobacteraceae bacterium]
MIRDVSAVPPFRPFVAPRVHYEARPLPELLDDDRLLALFGFGAAAPACDDPRYLRVALEPLDGASLFECWRVDGAVTSGHAAGMRWSAGGGLLFAALDDIRDGGDIEAQARHAYAGLAELIGARPSRHVQRLWNYLGDINAGDGDDERYKRFCAGRARGMDGLFDDGFPAATAIGHREGDAPLQLYCLAADATGTRVENPRQLSAWRYPRQYGPTAPSFARAMRLPGDAVLAISGTASIVGHRSLHEDDLDAQLDETLANLRALAAAGGFDGRLEHAVLKAYVRHAEHAGRVDAFLAHHLPNASRLLLAGDICRRELLVEIDGWLYGPGMGNGE